MNRRARRAQRADKTFSKLELRGSYDDMKNELSDPAMALIILVLRKAVDDLDRQTFSDRELYACHVELIESGLVEIYMAADHDGLSVKTEVNIPGFTSLGAYWDVHRAPEVMQ